MNVLKKVINKLWKNFNVLGFSLLTSKSKKDKDSKTNALWTRTLATNCGAFPIYFPRRREITDTYWGNKILLTSFFMWLSYKKINKKLKKNNSIFVSLNEMGTFLRKILPKINVPFVLVTGDSDYSSSNFEDVLNNKYLIHWFAQNNTLYHEKITSLPLGLDFHSLLSGKCFGEESMSATKQEGKLEKVRSLEGEREVKIFANFHLSYTSDRRKELYPLLKDNPIMYFQKKKMPRTMMWKFQKQFAFNFSPMGNGLDCIRTWESLALGQIPVIERTNTALDEMYSEFPIVVIDDVSEINERNIRKWYKKYSVMFNNKLEEKLTNRYWISKIKEKQFL